MPPTDWVIRNPLALGATTLLVVVTIGILIRALTRARGPLARTIVWVSASVLVWHGFELVGQLAVDVATAEMGRDLLRIGPLVALPAAAILALRLANRRALAEHPATSGLAAAVVLVSTSLSSAGLLDETLQLDPRWGWRPVWDGSWPQVVLGGLTGGLVLLIGAVLIVAGLRTVHPTRRRLRLAAGTIVLLGGVFEFSGPLLGTGPLPILASVLTVFTAIATRLSVERTSLEPLESGAARALLDAIGDILLVFEPDGTVRYANSAAQAFLNVDASGATLGALFRSAPEAEAFRAATWSEVCEGRRRHGLEMTFKGRHGRPLPVFVSLCPFTYDGERTVVLLAHDLTAFREMQAELVAARSQVDRAQRDGPWLNQVGDDLRGPLDEILVLARRLEAGADAASPTASASIGGAIELHTMQLVRLVSDVVDLARLEAGKLPLAEQTLGLDQLLTEAEPRLRALSQPTRSHVSIECEPVPVVGDPGRLTQAVLGIVAFAVRLAPGQPVELVGRRAGEETVLEVRLAEAAAPRRLVEDVLRGVATEDDDPATRLSLVLARRICQRSGGSLELVYPGPSQPLCFVVRLRGSADLEPRPVPSELSTQLD